MMSQEPGHSEVVNSLLDLQACLRGDPEEPAPGIGDTMVDARPPVISEPPSMMPDETAAAEDTSIERNDTTSVIEGDGLSVIEGDVAVTMGSSPRAELPDLEAPAPPVPGSTSFWNVARPAEVPAPPATDSPAGLDVPAPVLLEPDREIPPSPLVPQTREEQITELAERIDRLEQELTFVAEELWRLAGNPPTPPEHSV
jgi:hypothetical protein